MKKMNSWRANCAILTAPKSCHLLSTQILTVMYAVEDAEPNGSYSYKRSTQHLCDHIVYSGMYPVYNQEPAYEFYPDPTYQLYGPTYPTTFIADY